MKIVVADAGQGPVVGIEEQDTFTEFVVVASAAVSEPQLRSALSEIGEMAGDDHVFIDREPLKALVGPRAEDAEWLRGFDAMLGFATSRGWVNEQGGVRAHIERTE